jgi:hypothetical protein
LAVQQLRQQEPGVVDDARAGWRLVVDFLGDL